jgi:predicted nuclease with TOPRIM domain
LKEAAEIKSDIKKMSEEAKSEIENGKNTIRHLLTEIDKLEPESIVKKYEDLKTKMAEMDDYVKEKEILDQRRERLAQKVSESKEGIEGNEDQK